MKQNMTENTSATYSTIKYNDRDIPYEHRDLSWLDFNYRVLQEAMESTIPLMERIKFLAIYSNNLDEFFRVRVASNRNLMRVGKKTKKKLDFEPEDIQRAVIKMVNHQQEKFTKIFEKSIIPALAENHINIKRADQLTEKQRTFIDDLFMDKMLPFVQPILLVKDKIRPFLNNRSIYLMIHLKDKSKAKPRSEYALVNVPSDQLPRFIELKSQEGHHDIIYLDDLVRSQLPHIFPGYTIVESYSIKVSRDADLYIDDEFSGDLVVKIKNSLNKRKVGPASRLVYDRSMPKLMLEFLKKLIGISDFDHYKEGRYHNNFDLFSFPDFGKKYLKYPELPPVPLRDLEHSENIFHNISSHDHLIHVPYESYESVVRFFESAANDPDVTHIKIVQYRVAAESRIMNALIKANKTGKNVSAFVEVKARFDEESNLKWGEILEQHGINVRYSFPGLKVHSKLALVRRVENGKPVLYGYLGTGNFHENTAKVYADLGLFTKDTRLTEEMARVFSFLETVKVPLVPFQHLLVGQFNLKKQLIDLVKFEIEQAKKGKTASIILKMNSLQDTEMIDLLYKASQAGVKIKLIVRGLCSLIPGIKGISDNIEAISIVDRFLEHARVFHFHHAGKPKMYLGSADWMERNLHRRIETLFPIYDTYIYEEILDMLKLQWRDNTKSRWIHHKKNNQFRKESDMLAIRSQLETYYYYKRKYDAIA